MNACLNKRHPWAGREICRHSHEQSASQHAASLRALYWSENRYCSESQEEMKNRWGLEKWKRDSKGLRERKEIVKWLRRFLLFLYTLLRLRWAAEICTFYVWFSSQNLLVWLFKFLILFSIMKDAAVCKFKLPLFPLYFYFNNLVLVNRENKMLWF